MNPKPTTRNHIVVVQGPTASGKSELGVRIAGTFDGEVVIADSLQWVRYFDIGTAKPGEAERAGIPHHLIDSVEPDEHTDAAVYVRRARAAIDEVLDCGRLPVVVGGTGLYVRSLLCGLVDLPGRDPGLRETYDRIICERGLEALFDLLESRAPEAARYIDRRNPPRVVRALEILELTGRPIWEWQAEHGFSDRPYNAFRAALKPGMDWLRPRVERRTKAMLAGGLVEEVERLLERYPDRSSRAFGAIGYREVLEYLDGRIERAELEAAITRATLRYARKQLGWLRRETEVNWFRPGEEELIVSRIAAFIKNIDKLPK